MGDRYSWPPDRRPGDSLLSRLAGDVEAQQIETAAVIVSLTKPLVEDTANLTLPSSGGSQAVSSRAWATCSASLEPGPASPRVRGGNLL